jgi:YidC/Oxa1 family membrane protein insertase
MQGHGPNQQNPEEMRNLIIFVVLSLAMWLCYDHFVLKPKAEAIRAVQVQQAKMKVAQGFGGTTNFAPKQKLERNEIITSGQVERIRIENAELSGSFSTKGGRIDDLLLKNYYKTLDEVENVELLSPANSFYPHYGEFGWIAVDSDIVAPTKNTQWQVLGTNTVLSAENPVSLQWQNGQGVTFIKEYSIDDKFLISVEQSIENTTNRELQFYPYSLISRHGQPDHLNEPKGGGIYEGPIGYINNDLKEESFKKLAKKGGQAFPNSQGWIGIAQKYWLVAMLPDSTALQEFRFTSKGGALDLNKAVTQVDVRGDAITVSSGQNATHKMNMFVGAKVLKDLEAYSDDLGVKHFDLAVDFGMLYFITKPLYWLMNLFHGWVGNMGVAIIMITIVVRLLVFPLANASYRSFAGLRKIAPKMAEIREKHGDDKAQLQKELVKLYETERVNPMAGCLPILIQMPIFLAIFRVISMAIETRHAPFVGWIEDLSVRDPTSIINLFGLLPYDVPGLVPDMLNIGLWSMAMLGFMILQQRLSPPPQDPTQKMMFTFMPIVFTFILAGFPSGLVIYFTFSNGLGVLQQYVIMRMMGVEVHLFKRTEAEKKMEEAIETGPKIHPELEVIEHDIEEALFGEADDSEKAVDDVVEKPVKKAAKKPVKKTTSKSTKKPANKSTKKTTKKTGPKDDKPKNKKD